MKKYFWLFIVAGLNWVVAVYSILPLLYNRNRTEWFAVGIYQILLIIGWAFFFLLVFLVGLILRRSRYNIYGEVRNVFRFSILGTIGIVLFGIIKSQTDFNKWQEESNLRRIVQERDNASNFISAVDSLKGVIVSSDSSLAEPFFHLGLAYRHHGKWEESVKSYRIAVALDQGISSYFSELGYSESIIGRYDEAIDAYQLDSSRLWILDQLERCENLRMSRRRK